MVQMMMKLTLSKLSLSPRAGSLYPLVSSSPPPLVLKDEGDDEDEEDEAEGFPPVPQFHPCISMQRTLPSRHICHSCLFVLLLSCDEFNNY